MSRSTSSRPSLGLLVALTVASFTPLQGACASAPPLASCRRAPPPPPPSAESACQDPALQRVPRNELQHVLRSLQDGHRTGYALLLQFPPDTRLAAACAYLAARPAGVRSLAELDLLARLGAPAALIRPTLSAMLASPDPSHRRKAADALIHLGPAAAPDALALAAMGRDSVMPRIGPAAIPWLVAGLDSEHPGTRRVAASALARLGPDAAPATPCLIEALADPAAPVATTARHALRAIGPAAVPHLAAELDRRRPVIAAAAADVLAMLGRHGRAATGSLLSLLARAPRDPAAPNAVRALVAIGPPSIDAVDPLLDADHVATRLAAVSVLSGLPGRASAKLLADALSDSHLEVRAAAATGLLRFRHHARPAVPELIEATRDPAAGAAAVMALADSETTDPDALPVLLQGLRAHVNAPQDSRPAYSAQAYRLDPARLLDALARFGRAAAPAVPLLHRFLSPARPLAQDAYSFHALRVVAATQASDAPTVEALEALARAEGPESPTAAALLLALGRPATARADLLDRLALATSSNLHLGVLLQVAPHLRAPAPPPVVEALRAAPTRDARQAAGLELLVAELTHDRPASNGSLLYGLLAPHSPYGAFSGHVLASRSPEARDALEAKVAKFRKLVGNTHDPLSALRTKMKDRDYRVQFEAYDALAALGPAGRAALPDMMAFIAQKHPWLPLLERVANALAALGPHATPARPDLERLCREYCHPAVRSVFEGPVRALEHALRVIPPPLPPRAPAP